MNQRSLILIAAIAVIFAGCAQTAGYQDGKYSGAYSAFDSRGWKPYMNITVSGGAIVAVEFDSVNASGQLKSQDAAYNQRMGAASPTTVTKATPEAIAALLAKQAAPIDAITGATALVDNFNKLASALLAQAAKGNTSPVSLPMDGTYTAEGTPDARGYIGQISVTYKDDKITAVTYDEVKKDANGVVNYWKSKDPDYSARWGNDAPAVYAGYARALVATQNPATVDAVSGATSAHDTFVSLAAKVLAARGE